MARFSTGDKVTIQIQYNDGVRFDFLNERVGIIHRRVDSDPEEPEIYEVRVLVKEETRDSYTTLIPFYDYELKRVEE